MTPPLALSASLVTSYQSCKRKYALGNRYRVVHSRPRILFDALLRRAVVALSSGADPVRTATDASTAFLAQAARPGLDVPDGVNVYALAKDWAVTLEVVIRSLGRLVLLTLADAPDTPLGDGLVWRALASRDESSALHRWHTCDGWNADDLSRELHSWFTLGDIAALRVPMTIHSVEIGRTRGGRHTSAWTRAWRNPSLPNTGYHFRTRTGKPLDGWTPVRMTDFTVDVGEWVETMHAEGGEAGLVHHTHVSVPSDAACDEILRQVREVGYAMRADANAEWNSLPMSRGACDTLSPCPWQGACYAALDIVPERTGLYTLRAEDYLQRHALVPVEAT